MKMISLSFVRRLLFDEHGQTMMWVTASFVGMVGLSGLTLDVGRAYLVKSQVQSVVDGAALAGVSGISSGTAASLVSTFENGANQTSWGIGTAPNANAPSATLRCVTAVMPNGQSCSGNLVNAITVTETVNVPMFFMKIFRVPSLPVKATATATPAEARPWIVEIILDTTPSMSDSDSNCTGANTAEECALNGIQGMLGKLNPCPPGSSSCTDTNANIRFGLRSFPNISISDAQYNYCNTGTVKYQLYSNPVPPQVVWSTTPVPGYPNVYAPEVTPASYTPIKYGSGTSAVTLTYQSTYGASDMDTNGFYINFFSATDASGLNPSSTLVKAIGRNADKVNPCLQQPSVPHSGVTSFAQAIYAAETALMAEQAAYPVVNNLPTRTAIVFLSDGQANALAQDYYPDGTAVTSNGMNVSGSTKLNSNLTIPTGLYPSGIDACQQAITAAHLAASFGTRVYTVAYGAENGGCLYYSNGVGKFTSTVKQGSGGSTNTGEGSEIDQTSGSPLVSSGSPLIVSGNLNVPMTSITDVVPCNTIKNMASDMAYFYSDANQEIGTGTSGIDGVNTNCTSPTHTSLTSLNDIFQDIYGSLTAARLIPNNSI